MVGTTADYIEKINRSYPGRSLFITDFRERKNSQLHCPEPADEILVNLEKPLQVLKKLKKHLKMWGQGLTGITAFDCESLSLTAQVAKEFGLSFSSNKTIGLCRDKLKSKELWLRAGLPSPKAFLIASPAQIKSSWDFMKGPVVLKPLQGSGSELVFKCNSSEQAAEAWQLISDHLANHPNKRLYPRTKKLVLMEELIKGEEFSCDFLIKDHSACLLRLARKYQMPGKPIGTMRAYMVPAVLPKGLLKSELESILTKAATSLGLVDTNICMTDFIVKDNTPFLLEMTPRPGGDCLPDLILKSCGLDMLGLCLDLAEGKSPFLPAEKAWRPLVGLRLFSSRGGTIKKLDASKIKSQPEVVELYLNRGIGDQITLPPDDYNSHLLGHLIFQATPEQAMEAKMAKLETLLKIKVE